ncbi:MAG TPA: hypothetical protein VL981_11535, partial [Candidatus Methylacidiphilales bacterium]|nr:hypothetical protein [Candidatus Methylacidiphilales bacterium]
FYSGQPAKSVAFDVGCVAVPILIALTYAVSRSVIGKLRDSFLPKALRLAVGVSWLLFLWCLWPIVDCPHPPPLEGMPPSWLVFKWFFVRHEFLTWFRFLYTGLGCWFMYFLLKHDYARGNRRLATAALFFVWVLLIPSLACIRSQINDDWRFTGHLNVITHALAQVINGHHFLVQFPHQYGGYIEFLGPVLALFPRQIETLLLPFPILHAVSVLALLLTVRLVIRSASLFFVTGLGLLALAFVLPTTDYAYAYDPIRTLFPALGLYAAVHFFRQPGRFRYGLVSCLAALAPLWNLDTGFVLWLSWSVTLVIMRLGERRPLQAFIDLAIQTGLLITSVTIFLLYLRIVSGLWPDPTMLASFQRLFMETGFMCLRMLVPDIWLIILTAYVIGLVTVFHFYFKKAFSWKTNFVLLLSLMGIGLFSYFTGRSAESNLAAVSYPAVLLTGILLDETRLLVSFHKLPRITWALLLPAGIVIAWWGLIFSLALPDLLAGSGSFLENWRNDPDTPFKANAAFVQKWTVPGEKVFMLSDQSGFYYYLTDTVCPINIPGTGELIWSKDSDLLIANLSSAQFPKLFVEKSFYDIGAAKPEVFRGIQEAIAQHYRAVATSPTGQVTLYIPR